METILNDLRQAARSLRKASGLTAVAVVVLAVGIGANTAIFTVVDAVLLRPLPYPGAERLVTLAECDAATREPEAASAGNFLDWRDSSRSFEAIAAYRGASFNLSGGAEPERIPGAVVTADFFHVMGVAPAIGQAIATDGTAPGSRLVVLSDGLWKRRYAASAEVVGRQIQLNGENCTIVGVMPAGFQFPEAGELWVSARYRAPEYPLAPSTDPSTNRDRQYFDVVGRMAAGVTPDAAQSELDALARRLAEAYPTTNANRGVRLVGLQEQLVGDRRSALVMLLGAVGFVLLIACANVANLLVVRAAGRRKEMATRLALGASRWRLVRQSLAESILLSTIGGAIGLGLAVWGVRPLAALAPQGLLRDSDPPIDVRVLGFTVAASLVTGLLFGLLPAIQSSLVDVNEVLKDGERGTTGGLRHNRVRSALVVVEIATSLVLLVGAGLSLKSLGRLEQVRPGFDPRGLVTAQVWLSEVSYPEPEQKAAFFARVLEHARAIPGVESVAATTRMPLAGGSSSRSYRIVGQAPPDPTRSPEADYRVISTGYFRTMGIPILAGRDFADRDAKGAPFVAIVDEAFAARSFPGEDPIGKQVALSGSDDAIEIVGVVGNVHHSDLATEPRASMYVPFEQTPWPFMTLALRTSASSENAGAALAEAVRAVDPNQPLASVATMDRLVARAVEPQQFNASLLGAFAGVAVLLAIVGIYGVVSYSVTQRVREIGIRMALGAGRRDVFRLVVGQAVVLAGGGVACGLGASLALTRLLAGMLYDVSPTDPSVFAAVALALAATTVLASVLPARRATRVDPMVALRYE